MRRAAGGQEGAVATARHPTTSRAAPRRSDGRGPEATRVSLGGGRPAVSPIATPRSTRSRLLALTALAGIVDVAALLTALGFTVGEADAEAPRTVVLGVAVAATAIACCGLYRPAHVLRDRYVRRVVRAASAAVLAQVVLAAFTDIEWLPADIARLWAATVACLLAGRVAVRLLGRVVASRRALATRALIVGTNDDARALARLMFRRPGDGVVVVGFVATSPWELDTVPEGTVLGHVGDIGRLVRDTGAEIVVVAGRTISDVQLDTLSKALRDDVELRFSLALSHLAADRLQLEPVGEVPLVRVRRRSRSRVDARATRVLDVVVAGAAVVVALPVLAVIAAVVKATSRGPVLFRQLRVGAGGKPFVMYKFRTMVTNAELWLDDPELANEADGLLFKVVRDPRVTSVGQVLRRWCLDELPQLFNVVRGEMSLVGPRPALPAEVAKYTDGLRARLNVKPGMTGLWQVNGRHDLPFDDYCRYDLFYVENRSFGLDVRILARTVPAVLRRRGAY